MADYHPLIARAVAGLDKNTGENRRALYERARTALVAQLRGVQPALEESEITRERLALEEAIRKVEAESARHARETARPTFIKRAEVPRRDEQPPRQETPRQETQRQETQPRPAVAGRTATSAAPAAAPRAPARPNTAVQPRPGPERSEEHTSELQSPDHLVCRLLLEKKKKNKINKK